MSVINFKPFKRQFEALEYLRDNKTTEILYWWWARWGKSYFWCAWIIINCFSMPWSTWLIWRNELKRLRHTTLETFFEVLRDFGINEKAYNYNAQDSTIKFVNWSVVYLVDLSYMPSDPNYDRLWSYWLTGDFIDEAQEIRFKAINTLKGRYSNLKGNGWKTTPKSLRTCNPAKNWIYNEFYKKWRDWTLEEYKAFVPSLVIDNPHISPEYIEQLKRADKVTVERLLNWNFEYDATPWKLYEYDKLSDMFSNPIHNWLKCITCDVARAWRDKAVIMVWNWFEVIDHQVYHISTITDLEMKIREFCQKYTIWMSNVLVDEDWVWGWLVDWLECKGFVNNSTPIDTRNKIEAKQHVTKSNYQNLKTQCYFELANYIQNNTINLKTLDQYKQEIMEELDIVCEVDIDKDSKKRIIKKEDIKEQLGRSPDFSDTIMMRMWYVLNDIEQEIDDIQVQIEYQNAVNDYLND